MERIVVIFQISIQMPKLVTMKLFLLFGIIYFCHFKSFAQNADGSELSEYYQKTYDEIDNIYQLRKNNDIEFRLWTNSSISIFNSVFILTKKGDVWQSKYFTYTGQTNNKRWIEKETKQTKLDSLWKRLLNNSVLSLPPQDSLKDRMKIFSTDTSEIIYADEYQYSNVIITDGVQYIFQIKTPNINRTYYYQSPGKYLKYYPNIEELYRAYAIKSIVYKFLGIPLNYE